MIYELVRYHVGAYRRGHTELNIKTSSPILEAINGEKLDLRNTLNY